jgi:small subunit ribosomal protein S20
MLGVETLANHKSALKRARQNETRRLRNKSNRTRIKTIVKDLWLTADSESTELKETFVAKLDAAKSAIDKASKKGIFHKKTASRKISRLAKLVNKSMDAPAS